MITVSDARTIHLSTTAAVSVVDYLGNPVALTGATGGYDLALEPGVTVYVRGAVTAVSDAP